LHSREHKVLDMQLYALRGALVALAQPNPSSLARAEDEADSPATVFVADTDPHLHEHVYTFNSTFDESEQCWKAVQFGELKRNAPYYERAFHNRLATRLGQLGYHIERRGRFFEVAGISDDVIQTFSKRTRQIEEEQERRGIHDPEAKGRLGAINRELKMKEVPREELERRWRSWLTPEQLHQIEQLGEQSLARCQGRSLAELQMRAPKREPDDFRPEQRALDAAILHCFERASAVGEPELLGWALHYGVGQVDPERLRQLVRQSHDLLPGVHEGRAVLTTPEVRAEELAMVEWVMAGQRQRTALAPGRTVQSAKFSDEQRAAIRHVWESTDSVTGIRGRSGTGNTTVTRERSTGSKRKAKRCSSSHRPRRRAATSFDGKGSRRRRRWRSCSPTKRCRIRSKIRSSGSTRPDCSARGRWRMWRPSRRARAPASS
jgi:hypothetical protein